MNFSRFRLIGLSAALLAITACSAPEPFVLRSYEFDRENKYFPVGPKPEHFEAGIEKTGILNATVCYAGKDVDPAKIWALAREECARFHAVPTFGQHSLVECPLTTPRAAVFTCKLAVATNKSRKRSPSPGTGSTDDRPMAPTTEDSPKFLFGAPGVNDRREQK